MPQTTLDGFRCEEIQPGHEVNLADLSQILVGAVANGASVGFLTPFSDLEAQQYWRRTLSQLGPGLRLWTYGRGHQILGTVQMLPCRKANARHRAEVVKLLVHQQWQRRGIAQALLLAVDHAARTSGIRLLVLDTLSHSDAARLYERAGWINAGSVPDYALTPEGAPSPTSIFYRTLSQGTSD